MVVLSRGRRVVDFGYLRSLYFVAVLFYFLDNQHRIGRCAEAMRKQVDPNGLAFFGFERDPVNIPSRIKLAGVLAGESDRCRGITVIVWLLFLNDLPLGKSDRDRIRRTLRRTKSIDVTIYKGRVWRN